MRRKSRQPRAPAKLFVPQDDTLGTSWTTVGFDDAGWTSATAGIGYQLKVPGFTVEDAKSTQSIVNLDLANDVLDGLDQQSETTSVVDVVNFRDPGGGGGSGNFGSDDLFPNDGPGDDNDFAIRATGTIVVPTGGTWTFGINSDDGASLTIGGQSVIDDDTLHAPRDTFGVTTLSAGEHELELVFFERGGGAESRVVRRSRFVQQLQLAIQIGWRHQQRRTRGSPHPRLVRHRTFRRCFRRMWKLKWSISPRMCT